MFFVLLFLTSLSMIISSCIHVTASDIISFFFFLITIIYYYFFFLTSLLEYNCFTMVC